MNSLLYDRKTAYIAVALMVLVSVFILGGNSLRREYNRVMDVFSGQNEPGIDVQQESIIILQNAFNLLVVADRYLLIVTDEYVEENAHAGRLRAILDTAPFRTNHLLYWDRLNWEDQLITVNTASPFINELLEILKNEEISETSAGHLTEIEGNINAALRRMNLSGYRSEFENFNNVLRSPYTALIATVRGVRPLPVPSHIIN